ncbi:MULTISPECIES: sigma-70 family RNA polymerase sigma factor [Bhargavaea]|uniref:Sigma-70 family RNA polymerase sigma factor n=1 Tax=Bhargavaea changchunensis TaxID=2134037 RepID=A0ABW2NGG5_9BACL|nr:sigma-70 family RNA polymerase sigma factor [Bhargavaea sp. CC-171006]
MAHSPTETSAGQRELFDSLVRLHADELKRIAYIYVHDHAECEDIVQEVFISCYKNLGNFRQESEYKTWLIRITINKCKDHHRKWNFRNLVYKPVIGLFKTGPSAEDKLMGRHHSQEMIVQISALPAKYKEVLILYYYQDMGVAEISKVLDQNVNTIKTRLQRGRESLKLSLERSKANGSV